MSDFSNPYAPVASPYSAVPNFGRRPLASLGKRFLGALIDGIFSMILVVPGYLMFFIGTASARNANNDLRFLTIVGAILMLVGFIVCLGVQLFLLYRNSQTVGKLFMKTQIVDFQTGQRATFMNVFLLRWFVNGLISSVPCLGIVYALVDICFIFKEDRRCIHDLLAKTTVVDIS